TLACEVATVKPGDVKVETLSNPRGPYRRPGMDNFPIGDLMFSTESAVAQRAYVLQPVGKRLDVWEVRHHMTPSAVNTFATVVEAAAKSTLDGRRLRGMSFDWRLTKERPLRRDLMRYPSSPGSRLFSK